MNYVPRPAKSGAEADDKVAGIRCKLTKKESEDPCWFTGTGPSDLNRGARHIVHGILPNCAPVNDQELLQEHFVLYSTLARSIGATKPKLETVQKTISNYKILNEK